VVTQIFRVSVARSRAAAPRIGFSAREDPCLALSSLA
jgi:hypothetical protein